MKKIKEIRTTLNNIINSLSYEELIKVCGHLENTYHIYSNIIFIKEEDNIIAFFEFEFECMQGVYIRFPLNTDGEKLKKEKLAFLK